MVVVLPKPVNGIIKAKKAKLGMAYTIEKSPLTIGLVLGNKLVSIMMRLVSNKEKISVIKTISMCWVVHRIILS